MWHVLKKKKFDVIFYWEVVLMQRWESLHFFVAGRFFGEEKDIKIVLWHKEWNYVRMEIFKKDVCIHILVSVICSVFNSSACADNQDGYVFGILENKYCEYI